MVRLRNERVAPLQAAQHLSGQDLRCGLVEAGAEGVDVVEVVPPCVPGENMVLAVGDQAVVLAKALQWVDLARIHPIATGEGNGDAEGVRAAVVALVRGVKGLDDHVGNRRVGGNHQDLDEAVVAEPVGHDGTVLTLVVDVFQMHL